MVKEGDNGIAHVVIGDLQGLILTSLKLPLIQVGLGTETYDYSFSYVGVQDVTCTRKSRSNLVKIRPPKSPAEIVTLNKKGGKRL